MQEELKKEIETVLTEEIKKEHRIMQTQYGFFGLITFVYSIISIFCIYKNPSGILFPVFIVISLVYMAVILERLGRPLQKNSLFYLHSIMLLGVSTFCTDNSRIIMLNKMFLFVLGILLLLHQFCDTSKWQPGKYLAGMLQIVFGSMGEVGNPFGDGLRYFKEKNKILSKNVAAVLIGIGVAFPLLWIASMLLADADAVFGSLVDAVLNRIRMGDTYREALGIILRILAFFVMIYAWLSYLSEGHIKSECRERKKCEPIIAITAIGLLSTVYLLFCGIQVIFLFFGGGDLPAGYTYAGYAREGFFQLLAVSIMNLVIVLIGLYMFGESKVLKGILTVMSICTFVMIISSALRMIMYIRYYYLTFQRVVVLWSLAVLFVVFIGVIRSIYKREFNLFRYGVIVVTVIYLAFSFSHPDCYIARINLSNAYSEDSEHPNPKEGDFFQSEDFYRDFVYLRSTGADTAPAWIAYAEKRGWENMTDYEKEHTQRYLDKMEDKAENDSWRNFNISRYIVKKMLSAR